MVGPISIKAPKSLLDKIDDWRANQRPILSRGDAIRKLVEAAFAAQEKPPKKESKS